MSLKVTLDRRIGGTAVVSLEGRLDTSTASTCEHALGPLWEHPPRRLVLDLAGLQFISSLGIQLVLKARRLVEGAGGVVVLTNLSGPIAKVFEITAALPAENIFRSVAEADAYFAAIQRKESGKQAG